MRKEIFYRPDVLLARLAQAARDRARLRKLRRTCAKDLQLGHIDSLELLELLREFDIRTIYDVGANIGTWVLLAKALFPGANVEAFEPFDAHTAEFLKTTGGLNGVRIHRTALGSSNGSELLRVTQYTDASSLLSAVKANSPELREVDQVEIAVRRLDDYRGTNSLPYADLIKIDVQGYELEVLKGATDCLAQAKAVIAEASFAPIYEGQCFFEDIVAFLAKHRFSVAALGEQTLRGAVLEQTDVLFLRNGDRRPASK